MFPVQTYSVEFMMVAPDASQVGQNPITVQMTIVSFDNKVI